MLFKDEIEFDTAEPEAALAALPSAPAVFSLRGSSGEPYLNRTADLQRRLRKLLLPAPGQTRRLQLAHLVRRIAWTSTASEFGAQLLLYRMNRAAFGTAAARRMRLRTPFFLRMGMRNRFPRVWVTNTLTASAFADLFGPFPSRHAAEHYAEQVLDLHLLRRCFQDLAPDPAFPGCIYSEMKKCLAPCYGGCSDERYSVEAGAVHAFFASRGESLKQVSAAERDEASARLDFEGAAAAHGRRLKAEAAAKDAGEFGALEGQHGVLVQAGAEPDEVELYLLRAGVLVGPEPVSLLGFRLPNEHSGSSSLFAHPAAPRPAALGSQERGEAPDAPMAAALANLNSALQKADRTDIPDHQALLARWWFRPQSKREGELVFAQGGQVNSKALLRACARVYRAHAERTAPALA